MSDWQVDLGLSFLFTFLKNSVKNEKSKARFKRAFLKLRDSINLAYAGDEDFA